MEYIRTIEVTNGCKIEDVSMPLESESLKIIVDDFVQRHNAKEMAGDDTYAHYLSNDGSSFLGVYHVQKFHQ